MKTLQDYIDKLNKLNFKEMYNDDFFWTWDKTDDELEAVFTVADALRFMRENNISTKVFESGLGISIFRDNSTRTRFSFASACNLLGLTVQDLDEKKSQIAHGETVRETANMVSFMADVIGIPRRYVHRQRTRIPERIYGRSNRRKQRRHPGAETHSGKPAVRRGPSHTVYGRYAAYHS